MWTGFLWDTKTKEILYDNSGLPSKNIKDTTNKLEQLLSSYETIEKNNIKGIFGVSKSYIDGLVKEEIQDVIRKRKFSADSYIWINEVLNYEGGEDYAVRRVHPNLPHTEGEYLSTDQEDVRGNRPYLEELEGINKNGDLFFTYYFKEFNNMEISQKITYAKLYKDYNWIMAMGVHLDDIDHYAEKANKEIYYLSSETIIRLLRYIFIVLLIGFIVLYTIEKKHFSSSTSFLETEINKDTLTKAYSRRYGQRSLNTYLRQYKVTGENAAVMMFDIDGFKDINDRYGHKAGDLVLIEMVKAIKDIIRSSDQLIRWGGDEFVCIFPGFREENIMGYSERLLADISALKIPIDGQIISIGVSIGLSYFKDTDTDYNEVLKRADDAMYHSKKQGKNRVSML